MRLIYSLAERKWRNSGQTKTRAIFVHAPKFWRGDIGLPGDLSFLISIILFFFYISQVRAPSVFPEQFVPFLPFFPY